ncbi:hypothetical protein QP735_01965 [Curtobacterium citreum]|nr:hypothetical protein [Curtobacterium citreum]
MLVLSIVILGVVATAATSGRVIIVPALVTATPAVPPALATGETGSGLVVWFVSVAITLFGIDLAGMLRRNRRNT